MKLFLQQKSLTTTKCSCGTPYLVNPATMRWDNAYHVRCEAIKRCLNVRETDAILHPSKPFTILNGVHKLDPSKECPQIKSTKRDWAVSQRQFSDVTSALGDAITLPKLQGQKRDRRPGIFQMFPHNFCIYFLCQILGEFPYIIFSISQCLEIAINFQIFTRISEETF